MNPNEKLVTTLGNNYIQNYIANGIIPTIQLITTYETKANPLDTETVEKTIKRYFK